MNEEVTKTEIPKYDIEERLISFAVAIIDYVESLPNLKGANHIGNQLLRSGTSPALNYGEAQAAESMADFIHKMRVCLKELRETSICLKILQRKKYTSEMSNATLSNECTELVRIFKKSVQTAEEKRMKKKQ